MQEEFDKCDLVKENNNLKNNILQHENTIEIKDR